MVNFTDTQPIDIFVTDLAFGAGATDAELKALFDPLIVNSTGINWTGFRIDLVDVDSAASPGGVIPVHPNWAHFHDSTLTGWLNPSTGVFSYNPNEGYDRSTQLPHTPPAGGFSSLTGASELQFSGGTFATGTTESWSAIGVHEWGAGFSTANFFVIKLTPLFNSSDTTDFTNFNGDGHTDILWQNTNGQAAIWEMNGTNQIPGGGQLVGPNPGTSWKEIGTGDFNGDGHSDILWQNTNGQAAIWEMNGTNQIPGGGQLVGANPGPNWNAIGTGDFNGDGHSDILWQNTTGRPRSGK